MALRSIPHYQEVQRMCAELCYSYYKKNSVIYDLGSSTGQMALMLSRQFSRKKFTYCGIDNSAEMVKKACLNTSHLPTSHHTRFFQSDIRNFPLPGTGEEKTSIILANYTLQFLAPRERAPMLKKIFEHLPRGGILIFSEKVLESAASTTDLFVKFYYEFKKRNGYSELEIAQKREALENVLIPLSEMENREALAQAGFSKVSLFFKWYNFASYLAEKT
jgi:tRNA (cmo5U34)-methyltransferase